MHRVVSIYRLTVVKKVLMALSGVILFLFVVGHLFGNLKLFLGRDEFNTYAAGLRTVGQPFLPPELGLWIARLGLLAALLIHVIAAVELYLLDRRARPVAYRRLEFTGYSYASALMTYGGLALFLFVIYHLLHFTFGTVHPSFVPGDPYHNVVSGFQHPLAAIVYILAMVPLGLHLYHGLWSATQTLGANRPACEKWRRPLAGCIAIGIVLGNIAIPLAVLSGVVR